MAWQQGLSDCLADLVTHLSDQASGEKRMKQVLFSKADDGRSKEVSHLASFYFSVLSRTCAVTHHTQVRKWRWVKTSES